MLDLVYSLLNEVTVLLTKKRTCSLGSIDTPFEISRMNDFFNTFTGENLSFCHHDGSKHFEILEISRYDGKNYEIDDDELNDLSFEISNQLIHKFIDFLNDEYKSNMYSIGFFNIKNESLKYDCDGDDIQIVQIFSSGLYLLLNYMKNHEIVFVYGPQLEINERRVFERIVVKRYGQAKIEYRNIKYNSGLIAMINCINLIEKKNIIYEIKNMEDIKKHSDRLFKILKTKQK